jgi:hypothetical protein
VFSWFLYVRVLSPKRNNRKVENLWIPKGSLNHIRHKQKTQMNTYRMFSFLHNNQNEILQIQSRTKTRDRD